MGETMFEINHRGDHLEVAFRGMTLASLLEAVEATFLHPDFPKLNDLWIIGNQTLALQFSDLQKITDFAKEKYPARATRNRTALLVVPGMNAGLAELWADSAGELPYQVKVFYRQDDAMAWLRG